MGATNRTSLYSESVLLRMMVGCGLRRTKREVVVPMLGSLPDLMSHVTNCVDSKA
jgi:hypothetical protein